MRIICLSILLLALTPLHADVIFRDSFESGDMSTTNSDGFAWGRNNRTSIVTMNPQCGDLHPGDPTVIYNNKKICNGPIEGRNWQAYDGDNSLRFRYPAGENQTEQRFSLGTRYMPEFWMRYFIRVPDNFYQGTKNNKFLAIWVDTYDRPGDVTWQTRPAGNGSANLVYQDGGVTSGETDPTPFISVPDDRGKWMEIIVHYKSASSRSASDGIIELYRKWVGKPNYEIIHRKTNANTFEVGSAKQGIHKGYFFGWANDPYDVDTEWLLDNVEIFDDLHFPNRPQIER